MDKVEIFQLLLTMVVFSLSDRWCGGGLGWNKLTKDHGGKLGGRPFYYVLIPLLVFGFAMGGVVGLLLALGWVAYRNLAGNPDGTITGQDLPLTLLRHLLMAVVAFAVFHLTHKDLDGTLVYVGYALAATLLAVWGGRNVGTQRDPNAIVEHARGAVFGAAFALTARVAAAVVLAA